MKEEDSNCYSRWEEELPSPDELIPISQTLITHDLAAAFNIPNPNHAGNSQNPPPPATPSGDSAAGSDEPARTLKRPRLVWTPQLHKRFVDAVAQLGIKNAVPKTIMQLMNVDGLTRENVASHLQKYRLYLKRIQGISNGNGAGSNGGGLVGSVDPATDHLFASSPVPPQFLHQARPYVPPMMAAPPVHPQLQGQYHGVVGHFGSPPNGQFENPFMARQPQQPVHRMGAQIHNQVGPNYGEDLELGNGSGGRKVLTLFPNGNN